MKDTASKKLSKDEYNGELELNGIKITCAILADGTRLIAERSFANAFGVKGGGSLWQIKKQSERLKRLTNLNCPCTHCRTEKTKLNNLCYQIEFAHYIPPHPKAPNISKQAVVAGA